MTDLLPCPFCGHDAVKETSCDGFTSIGCLYCNPLFGVMVQRETEADAIAVWNTRAERTCTMRREEVRPCADDGCNRLKVPKWVCTSCEWENIGLKPKYCGGCGAKVVEE